MYYDIAAISNAADRIVNEDSIYYTTQGNCKLLALADGLGGHGKGDKASQLAVLTAKELFNGESDPVAVLSEIFKISQERVVNEQIRLHNTQAMKTTLSLAIIRDDALFYGYIGDSRIYYFSQGKYIWRTLDHSVPQMLVSSGRLRESKIRGHEDRNRLLRVIGIEWTEPRYEIADKSVVLHQNDAVLLCSDGFWELITEKEMERAFRKSRDAADWLHQMEIIIRKAGKGRNMDNYSAIAAIAK